MQKPVVESPRKSVYESVRESVCKPNCEPEEPMYMTRLGRVGFVARFKPFHFGQSSVLEALCQHADEVLIGLGSSNRYNARNPFTAAESRDMINAVLKPRFSNYSFIEVPDLDNGPRWRVMIKGLFGELHHFATANDYVWSLLKDDYKLILPVTVVPVKRRVPLTATMVRRAMAAQDPWEHLCPEPVVEYIKARRLDERFRQEFGLATLAQCGLEYLQEVYPTNPAPRDGSPISDPSDPSTPVFPKSGFRAGGLP